MRLFGGGSRDLVKRAYQAWDAEDWQRAGELLEAAVTQNPDGRGSEKLWFDAALAYKFLRDWPKAYELGKEAAARVPRDTQEPAFWNLGIAATVMRDWATARDAWRGYGINLPDGAGEIVDDLGLTCVRIATASGEEVVWARRLCPTRARVLSVPFDVSRRFGEVVLHDGAPNGERIFKDQRFPVFDELMRFAPSDLATLSVTIAAATADDVEALTDAFDRAELAAEPLSSGQVLCKCCSEGSQAVTRRVAAGEQRMLLAAPEPRAANLLDAWTADRPDHRSWTNLHLAT
ncbi:tetratricopeptide repeat protein [Actinomycetes bacterium KLBMP 9797]